MKRMSLTEKNIINSSTELSLRSTFRLSDFEFQTNSMTEIALIVAIKTPGCGAPRITETEKGTKHLTRGYRYFAPRGDAKENS
ncbi:hypothetical protein SAMN00777080_4989 [Aquiflexum balticum DSM 16537]|uniref:Uncharacterized protein n=1 Tax=Aquiflexum balticum DSM 16537 TaxID=758820 RepID=A0A1W2HBP9_9BACT|nr:hypothetical protein [Aquiflexum balticum]SMD46305.1 hypothetical protein SAMN00777080_4989 [Aquiflexum balticum DSM 16537]